MTGMNEAFTDWRFLLVLLGFAFSLGSLWWAVSRHIKILNGGVLTRIEQNLATLIERANTHAEDIRELRKMMATETDKRESGISSIHARIDKRECK